MKEKGGGKGESHGPKKPATHGLPGSVGLGGGAQFRDFTRGAVHAHARRYIKTGNRPEHVGLPHRRVQNQVHTGAASEPADLHSLLGVPVPRKRGRPSPLPPVSLPDP